jgi:hypothetical protein
VRGVGCGRRGVGACRWRGRGGEVRGGGTLLRDDKNHGPQVPSSASEPPPVGRSSGQGPISALKRRPRRSVRISNEAPLPTGTFPLRKDTCGATHVPSSVNPGPDILEFRRQRGVSPGPSQRPRQGGSPLQAAKRSSVGMRGGTTGKGSVCGVVTDCASQRQDGRSRLRVCSHATRGPRPGLAPSPWARLAKPRSPRTLQASQHRTYRRSGRKFEFPYLRWGACSMPNLTLLGPRQAPVATVTHGPPLRAESTKSIH